MSIDWRDSPPPVKQLIFLASSEEDTNRLGAALAELLPDGTTVALCGTLGAGKTRLVQAMAQGCGIARRQVVSPTFVICHEYHGRRDLVHLDAYRIQDDDEFLQLGPEEYFQSSAITLIEWADRISACMPEEYIQIDIQVTGQTTRKFKVAAVGPTYEPVIDAIKKHLENHE